MRIWSMISAFLLRALALRPRALAIANSWSLSFDSRTDCSSACAVTFPTFPSSSADRERWGEPPWERCDRCERCAAPERLSERTRPRQVDASIPASRIPVSGATWGVQVLHSLSTRRSAPQPCQSRAGLARGLSRRAGCSVRLAAGLRPAGARSRRRRRRRRDACCSARSWASSSGCHWTLTTQPSTDSIASIVPSSARPVTTMPSATRSTAWWCTEWPTGRSVPIASAARQPGCQLDRVALEAVIGGALVAEMLDQRPAERHVEHLVAAADGEDRHPQLDRRPGQRQVERVVALVDAVHRRVDLDRRHSGAGRRRDHRGGTTRRTATASR